MYANTPACRQTLAHNRVVDLLTLTPVLVSRLHHTVGFISGIKNGDRGIWYGPRVVRANISEEEILKKKMPQTLL